MESLLNSMIPDSNPRMDGGVSAGLLLRAAVSALRVEVKGGGVVLPAPSRRPVFPDLLFFLWPVVPH